MSNIEQTITELIFILGLFILEKFKLQAVVNACVLAVYNGC